MSYNTMLPRTTVLSAQILSCLTNCLM